MDSSRTRLKKLKEARSTWRYYWHKNFLHSAMLRTIKARRYVSLSVLKFVLPIYMVHLVVRAGELLLILISSPSLLIISCPRFCVIMAYWNMKHGWQNASIIRNYCNLEEKKRWSCVLQRSGHVNYYDEICQQYQKRSLRQLRSINYYGTLDKTPRKCAHITVQEPSIISRGRLCRLTK